MANRLTWEQSLWIWAAIASDRDVLIRGAYTFGISKNRIHQITGVSRTTIDRVLEEAR